MPMTETQARPTRCFVVNPIIQASGRGEVRSLTEQMPSFTIDRKLEEACRLTEAIGVKLVASSHVAVPDVKPATLFSAERVERLAERIRDDRIDLVVVNNALTPRQQFNLEKGWKTKVLDRSGLILEIFGERAQTREGRLQVELAHLSYQRTRLVRSWTHLERQRGGTGFLGGPGETQLESDRRQLSQQIARLKRQIEDVKRTRGLHRAARARVPYPVVALVGYTNAGKSTLFNRLTEADVVARDQLFATLDPTMRLVTGGATPIIMSDTVGFVSDLPHELVAAFRATLEEVRAADVILHVRDVSDPEHAVQHDEVMKILGELGLGEDFSPPLIDVFNKIDLVSGEQLSELMAAEDVPHGESQTAKFFVSAQTGENVDNLLTGIDELVRETHQLVEVEVPQTDGKAVSWLYSHGEVLDQDCNADGCTKMRVRLSPINLGRFAKEFEDRQVRYL